MLKEFVYLYEIVPLSIEKILNEVQSSDKMETSEKKKLISLYNDDFCN